MRPICVHPAAPGTEEIGGGGKSQHLGMGGDILQPLGVVVGACNDAAVADNDSPDRYLALVKGGTGFAQRLLHIVLVGIVKDAHLLRYSSVKSFLL